MSRRVLAPLALLLGFLGCQHEPPALLPPASTVVVEGSLANRFVRAGEGGIVTARVHVRAELPRSTSREPSNVALVVDSSGSMAGAPLGSGPPCRGGRGRHPRRRGLAERRRLRLDCPGAPARHRARRRGARRRQDRARQAQRGGDYRFRGGPPRGPRRGAETCGVGDHQPDCVAGRRGAECPRDVAEPRRRGAVADLGAPISALGFGLEYDETVMGALARRSGGTLHDIQEPAEVAHSASEARRVKRVLAKSARIELHAGPGVQVTEVVGRERAGRGREVADPLGDLAGDEDKDVVVRFSATAHRPGAPVEICVTRCCAGRTRSRARPKSGASSSAQRPRTRRPTSSWGATGTWRRLSFGRRRRAHPGCHSVRAPGRRGRSAP